MGAFALGADGQFLAIGIQTRQQGTSTDAKMVMFKIRYEKYKIS